MFLYSVCFKCNDIFVVLDHDYSTNVPHKQLVFTDTTDPQGLYVVISRVVGKPQTANVNLSQTITPRFYYDV